MRTKIYQYFVRIEATNKKLTKEGFVLNNELIQKYWDTTFGKDAKPWDAISCERMALKAACDLVELVKPVKVRKVTVRIKGSNGAWIEASCPPMYLSILHTKQFFIELFVNRKIHYRTIIFGGVIYIVTLLVPEFRASRVTLEMIAGVIIDRLIPEGEIFKTHV